ncbi:UPF0041 domain-containing protein [Ascosphaera apis ARSEF 7405]|uniref:Mitochondrial pyruvate carrier n=1 Tax=Ascosphaera apis ARSEF 7405 TaxID=392613 RepID=A0A167V7G3_9EURO|nr:UPF0041 domain-containing protein [Ascosphaera apis ARSEF 7405]
MSSRLGLRFFQNSRAFFQSASRRNNLGCQTVAKRFSSTGTIPAEQQTFLQRSWNSPIGIRTVHFWAPVMKWVLVLAGIGDLARPADRLSLTQNGALTATGFIWTRWCFVIRPKNVLLATVNFFVGCVGAIQVSRILAYRASAKSQEENSASSTGSSEVAATAAAAAEKA